MKDVITRVIEPQHFQKMSVDEYKVFLSGGFGNKNKYNNSKCTSDDGNSFDSKKEMMRYYELKLLEKNRQIKDLKLQPSFLLLDKFELDGKTYRQINYIADFMYCDMQINKYVVEDVKGVLTGVYKLKKKLFLSKYKDIYIFREVF